MIYNYQYLEDEWTKGYWKLISNKLDHENECVWFNISGNDMDIDSDISQLVFPG